MHRFKHLRKAFKKRSGNDHKNRLLVFGMVVMYALQPKIGISKVTLFVSHPVNVCNKAS